MRKYKLSKLLTKSVKNAIQPRAYLDQKTRNSAQKLENRTFQDKTFSLGLKLFTGWAIKIRLHYFSHTGSNLNFPAIFRLAAVKAYLCGYVS